jgi:hypothetical protein
MAVRNCALSFGLFHIGAGLAQLAQLAQRLVHEGVGANPVIPHVRARQGVWIVEQARPHTLALASVRLPGLRGFAP